jgi:hypothetical protein
MLTGTRAIFSYFMFSNNFFIFSKKSFFQAL